MLKIHSQIKTLLAADRRRAVHTGQLAHLSAQIFATVLRVLLPGGQHRGQVPCVHAGGCRLLSVGGSGGPPARQQAGDCPEKPGPGVTGAPTDPFLFSPIQVEVCSPRISHLLSFCCDAFTKEQLCNLECLILLRLNFRLDAPTLAFFLDYYTNCVDAARLEDTGGYRFSTKHPDSSFAQKVCELSLADYAFNKYPPSVIAGSALWLTSDLMNPEGGQWSSSVVELGPEQISAQTSGYSENTEGDFLIFHNGENQGVQRSLVLECKDKLKLLVSLNKEMLELISNM